MGGLNVSENEQDAQKVHFKYVEDAAFRVVPATGAHGGVTPFGDVIANFFIDRPPVPEVTTQEMSPEGELGAETARSYGFDEGAWIVRHLQVGVVMKPDRARSIAEWLLRKAEKAEEAVNGAPTTGDEQDEPTD